MLRNLYNFGLTKWTLECGRRKRKKEEEEEEKRLRVFARIPATTPRPASESEKAHVKVSMVAGMMIGQSNKSGVRSLIRTPGVNHKWGERAGIQQARCCVLRKEVHSRARPFSIRA